MASLFLLVAAIGVAIDERANPRFEIAGHVDVLISSEASVLRRVTPTLYLASGHPQKAAGRRSGRFKESCNRTTLFVMERWRNVAVASQSCPSSGRKGGHPENLEAT